MDKESVRNTCVRVIAKGKRRTGSFQGVLSARVGGSAPLVFKLRVGVLSPQLGDEEW